ncbi:hypothetical protein [Pantoea brenneri]|uniref:hypothetical protein n=1 Tax=Pantoea brenneri TaxID=472694 RepID=UPI00289E502C|nr:hypothetical protein [Pantoea brenneri]
MNKLPPIKERLETIRSLLIIEGAVTSREIYLHMIPMGYEYRHVEAAIQAGYRDGTLHRRKLKNKCGYEYRLAEKYPRWGTRYSPEVKHRAFQRKITTICKKHSKVYQFDQLLKTARGNHANDVVLP